MQKMAILAIPADRRSINCHMTSLVMACVTFWLESYRSDICCRFKNVVNISQLPSIMRANVQCSFWKGFYFEIHRFQSMHILLSAYLRHLLDFSTHIRSPHFKYLIGKIESVQRFLLRVSAALYTDTVHARSILL